MIACPVCAKPVDIQEKHHGTLFTCGHCRGVYFIGWDGTPEKQVTHEPEPVKAAPPPPKKVAKPAPPSEPEPEIAPEAEPEAEIVIEPVVFDSPVETEAIPEPSWEAPAEETPSYEAVATEETPAQEEQPVMEETPTDFSAPLDPFTANVQGETSGDFADVAAYANSEDPAQGPLSYTVRIKGLELAETFETLREALTDSRFGWDAEVIMREVHGGELTLKGMNPTKASILINRVKYLPIEIDWNQEVFGGV